MSHSGVFEHPALRAPISASALARPDPTGRNTALHCRHTQTYAVMILLGNAAAGTVLHHLPAAMQTRPGGRNRRMGRSHSLGVSTSGCYRL